MDSKTGGCETCYVILAIGAVLLLLFMGYLIYRSRTEDTEDAAERLTAKPAATARIMRVGPPRIVRKRRADKK